VLKQYEYLFITTTLPADYHTTPCNYLLIKPIITKCGYRSGRKLSTENKELLTVSGNFISKPYRMLMASVAVPHSDRPAHRIVTNKRNSQAFKSLLCYEKSAMEATNQEEATRTTVRSNIVRDVTGDTKKIKLGTLLIWMTRICVISRTRAYSMN
jgi:hypothetical protein